MHQCTNNHIHISSPSPPLVHTEQWNCTQHKFYCCWQWLLTSLCPSFYDLLYPQYIPNALWIDVVLWALAFTLHFKCGCLWNGLEWNGKKEPVSYFHLSPSRSLTSVSFASLTPSPEINDKMSSIWNCVFPSPSVTVQDSVIITTTEMGKLYQGPRQSGLTWKASYEVLNRKAGSLSFLLNSYKCCVSVKLVFDCGLLILI